MTSLTALRGMTWLETFEANSQAFDLTSPAPQTQHVRLLYFSPDRICTSSVSCQCYWLEPKLKRLKATLITQTSSHCTRTHLWKPSLSYTPEAWLSPKWKVTPYHLYLTPNPSSDPTVWELWNFNSELILSSTYSLCYLGVSFSFWSWLGLGFERGSYSIAQACFEFAV